MPELKSKPESPKRKKQNEDRVLMTDALQLFDKFSIKDYLILIDQLRTDKNIFFDSD